MFHQAHIFDHFPRSWVKSSELQIKFDKFQKKYGQHPLSFVSVFFPGTIFHPVLSPSSPSAAGADEAAEADAARARRAGRPGAGAQGGEGILGAAGLAWCPGVSQVG